MSDIDDVLRRVEADDPTARNADAKALAAEVRRLRTALQAQREADTDEMLDQMVELFPTEGAKRAAARRAERRRGPT